MPCTDTCVSMWCDEPADFYAERMRRARKPHRCCECSRTIAVGEEHEYATGKNDGVFWDYRTCAECREIRQAYCCDSWLFGQLWESMREQMFWGWDEMKMLDCLAKLTTDAATAKVRAEYAEFCKDRDA